MGSKTKEKSFTELLSTSVIQSLLVDTPLYFFFGGNNLLLAFLGAVVGNSARKCCSEYYMKESLYRPFVCGGMGEAIKYGTSVGGMSRKKALLNTYKTIVNEYIHSDLKDIVNPYFANVGMDICGYQPSFGELINDTSVGTLDL